MPLSRCHHQHHNNGFMLFLLLSFPRFFAAPSSSSSFLFSNLWYRMTVFIYWSSTYWFILYKGLRTCYPIYKVNRMNWRNHSNQKIVYNQPVYSLSVNAANFSYKNLRHFNLLVLLLLLLYKLLLRGRSVYSLNIKWNIFKLKKKLRMDWMWMLLFWIISFWD